MQDKSTGRFLPGRTRPVAERFWTKVNKTDSCWLWTASFVRTGYGQFAMWAEGKMHMVAAHRMAWILTNGPIPPDMAVMHVICDNPPCVRPEHLALGTIADNNADMYAKGRNGQTGMIGERHHQAKLTWDDAAEIRRLNAAGMTISDLSRGFGVNRGAIRRIVTGRGWKVS
jgi:hypothetical protein